MIWATPTAKTTPSQIENNGWKLLHLTNYYQTVMPKIAFQRWKELSLIEIVTRQTTKKLCLGFTENRRTKRKEETKWQRQTLLAHNLSDKIASNLADHQTWHSRGWLKAANQLFQEYFKVPAKQLGIKRVWSGSLRRRAGNCWRILVPRGHRLQPSSR